MLAKLVQFAQSVEKKKAENQKKKMIEELKGERDTSWLRGNNRRIKKTKYS